MPVVRGRPESEASRPRNDLDGRLADGAWTPAADVTREGDAMTLKMDLSGLARSDVRVELCDRRLVVRGHRERDSREHIDGVVTRERVFGSFVRELALPAGVEPGDVHATFSGGVLKVEVQLPAEPGAQKIEIESGDPAVV